MVQIVQPRTFVYGFVVIRESRKFLLLQRNLGDGPAEVWMKIKDKKGHLVIPRNDQEFYDGPYWFYMKRSNAERKFAELARGVKPENCSL